jgi:hypothetical protein
MKKLVALIGILVFGVTLAVAQGTGEPGGELNQTWEQKQDAIKTMAGEIIQTKEQIQTLEQAKEQAQTQAEKDAIQSQIQTKEGELAQLQNQYEKMLQSHSAYKYEYKDANGDGVNDNMKGLDDPNKKAYMYKNGYGYGYGFVDEDGDGVNDNFVDANGDGKCDMDPAMTKTRLQVRDKVKGKSQHGDHNQEQGRDQLRGDK